MATFLYKLGRFAFRRRHFVALIWVALLTLAGVGAAVTGLLALKAQSDFDDAVNRSNAPSLSPSERAEARDSGLSASDRAEKTALVTDILTVGAVACASTAFVLWWFDRKQGENERRVTLLPEVSPTGLARLTLQGAF